MLEEKSITIQCPEGYEVDKEKSTFDKIVFKKKENALPMSWEELKNIEGFVINDSSFIASFKNLSPTQPNRNVWPTKELAEAALALSQLLQLRARWIGDWVPDWTDESKNKSVIYKNKNTLYVDTFATATKTLSFPNIKMAQKFLDTFRNLIETAKPLL